LKRKEQKEREKKERGRRRDGWKEVDGDKKEKRESRGKLFVLGLQPGLVYYRLRHQPGYSATSGRLSFP
jgi:hypothetical protein